MHVNPYDLTDADCVKTIAKIDSDPKIDLTDWEAGFINDNLLRNRFSTKQKEVLARMMEKYHVKVPA